MRKVVRLLVIAIFFNLIFSPLHAEPVISELTRLYQIVGETPQDLRREMNQKGPGGENGKTFDAYTAWRVNWRYRWWESGQNCRITSVTTKVDVTYTLPAWLNYTAAKQAAKRRWDSYYRALLDHEGGHRDLGIQAAREIETAILNLGSRKSCTILEQDANETGHEILARYLLYEKQYDVQTGHGAKTGAVFP